MAQKVKPIPEGHHSLNTYIVVSDAARAIEFYKKAFGAVEMGRFPSPDGKIAHAEVKIGDSRLMLSDEFPFGYCRTPESLGGTSSNLWIYAEDVDSMFHRAVQAGATVKSPPQDMFWGDRTAHLADPFGHMWTLATHKEDVSPEEMKRRGEIEMAKMAQQQRTQGA
jgi:PhnB protein